VTATIGRRAARPALGPAALPTILVALDLSVRYLAPPRLAADLHASSLPGTRAAASSLSPVDGARPLDSAFSAVTSGPHTSAAVRAGLVVVAAGVTVFGLRR
jgi:hypothetical protein